MKATFAQMLLWGAILAQSKEKHICISKNKVLPPWMADHIDFTDKNTLQKQSASVITRGGGGGGGGGFTEHFWPQDISRPALRGFMIRHQYLTNIRDVGPE